MNSANNYMSLEENSELQTSQHLNFSLLDPSNGEGNGTPLQYSCLENPMDKGAW